MVSIALACGEVPWEREVIDAVAQSPAVRLDRRYVDVGAPGVDAKAGTLAQVVIMSPALRGFDAKPVLALASAAHIVVLLDSIRPPWLAGAALDCRELVATHMPSLIDELAALPLSGASTSVVARSETGADIVVFTGTGGGVGTTSLAWLEFGRQPAAVIVDAASAPALGFLAGSEAGTSSLIDALAALRRGGDGEVLGPEPAARVLSVATPDVDLLGTAEADYLLDVLQQRSVPVIVDAGAPPLSAFAQALIARATQCVVVTSASPMGLLRIPQTMAQITAPSSRLVVNRFRDSLARGPRARAAIRDLVERTCGARPLLLDEDALGFDRAWIRGDWQTLRDRTRID